MAGNTQNIFSDRLSQVLTASTIVGRKAKEDVFSSNLPPKYLSKRSEVTIDYTVPTLSPFLAQQRMNGDVVTFASSKSEEVAYSHLKKISEFEPFRRGEFTQLTVYQFVYYMIVHKHCRLSYIERTLRNIFAYFRNGGGGDRLTTESKDFVASTPHGIGISVKKFFEAANFAADATGDEDAKRALCNARKPRALVFDEDQEDVLLNFSVETIRALYRKYVTGLTPFEMDVETNPFLPSFDANAQSVIERTNVLNNEQDNVSMTAALVREQIQDAIPTDDISIQGERTAFEFSLAFILGYLTGARVKSTLMTLSVQELLDLFDGKTVERYCKSAYARIFIPPQMVASKASATNVLRLAIEVRKSTVLYPPRVMCRHVMRGGRSRLVVGKGKPGVVPLITCPLGLDTCNANLRVRASQKRCTPFAGQQLFWECDRRLSAAFDRVYRNLFPSRARPRGVLWHSQRRRYLSIVSDRFGVGTASKSVGHSSIDTTKTYLEKGLSDTDTSRRAGQALLDRSTSKQLV